MKRNTKQITYIRGLSCEFAVDAGGGIIPIHIIEHVRNPNMEPIKEQFETKKFGVGNC